MRRSLTALSVLFLFSVTLGIAQTGAPQQTRQGQATFGELNTREPGLIRAVGNLLARVPDIEQICLREDGTGIAFLIGNLDQSGGSPEEIARRFLEQHAGLFGLSACPSGVAWRKAVELRHHDRVTQEYQLIRGGIPVYRGLVRFAFLVDGTLRVVGGQLGHHGDISNQRLLAASEAGKILTAKTGPKSIIVQTVPVLFPAVGQLRHAWQVRLFDTSRCLDEEVVVDAQTGQEWSRTMLSRSSRADPPPATTTGRGKVYLHHPLGGSPEIVPLNHLLNSRLQGLNLFVQNEDHIGASSSNGDFFYEPSNYHFDEVMAYYHTETAHQRYLDMGFNRERIGVLVWAGDDLDNAYYMPWANAIYLGDGGERFHPLSREETITYHEYAHAVVDKIQPLRGTEGSAMNEGQADFFACSFSDEPRIGEYVVTKTNRPYLRIMEHALHFPEDLQNEPHDDGRIWAGTLWDLRRRVGAAIAERIVFRSFFLLKEEPKYLDAIHALFEADRQEFQGQHLADLRDCFQNRGYPIDSPTLLDKRSALRLVRFSTLHADPVP